MNAYDALLTQWSSDEGNLESNEVEIDTVMSLPRCRADTGRALPPAREQTVP